MQNRQGIQQPLRRHSGILYIYLMWDDVCTLLKALVEGFPQRRHVFDLCHFAALHNTREVAHGGADRLRLARYSFRGLAE